MKEKKELRRVQRVNVQKVSEELLKNLDNIPEVEELFKQDEFWEDIKMMDLHQTDIFRLFELDGEPVIWENESIFVAVQEPSILKNGVAGVKAEKYSIIKLKNENSYSGQ
jgi:hypothetical protein